MFHKTRLGANWTLSCRRWLQQKRLACSPLGWLPAQVPGHVHPDLVRAEVIPDPYRGLFELGCQWVDNEDWCYRGRFSVDLGETSARSTAAGGTAAKSRETRLLRFEGLDSVGTVSLNGRELGRFNNMFLAYEFDVTEHLLQGENELLIQFEAATRVGEERRGRYLAENGLALDIERMDERAFVRKAQYMFGWDWGPRLVSAGIWREVWLLTGTEQRLTDVHVSQVHLKDGSVELCVTSTQQGPGHVVHELSGIPGYFHDGVPLQIREPQLWWPAGLGPQTLYTLKSYLVEPDLAQALCNTAPSAPRSESAGLPLPARRAPECHDQRTTRIGLRDVQLRQLPDDFGRSFEFFVNGYPVWCVGANWIPDHCFPSQISREQLGAQLQRARDMQLVMLRVWGGGLYETDDFYDLCDELGLLVWQDFPFACSYAPDNTAAQRELTEEAVSNVTRLRNHPSLVIWCGNNENSMMYEAKWGDKDRHPARCIGEILWEQTLPQLLTRLDPSRPYLPTSPFGGTGATPAPANGDHEGDQHNWDVWHGRGDWVHYTESRARFPSEFGFASAPSLRALKRMTVNPQAFTEADVRHPTALWHDKTLKGYDTFLGFVELHYPKAQNLEEWSYYSQLNQRDALRHGIEHYRRGSFAKGALIWQFNDLWPVQSWAALDSEGEYKALAYELRRIYAPCLVSVHLTEESIEFWAVLDNTREGITGTLEFRVTDSLDGHVYTEQALSVTLAPGERRCLVQLQRSNYPKQRAVASACFTTLPNETSALATSTFRYLAEPKDMRFTKPELHCRLVPGFLLLESQTPLFDAYLEGNDGDLSLDANFITLASAGTRRIPARGACTELQVRTLNGVQRVLVG